VTSFDQPPWTSRRRRQDSSRFADSAFGPQPVPPGLNWDAWLGSLPWRAYHPQWMAYAHWRETCSGGLGTFGPHTSIFPFMTLRLRSLWEQPAGEAEI